MANKTLPTLYSRTSTGATQQWSIEVSGNKLRVTSGQVDGKRVVNEWTVCDGKNIGRANETSPDAQALAEAQSKWDKRVKTGYTDNVKKIDTCTAYVAPMLAKKLKDRLAKIDWKRGVLVQNKFNGHRCVATFDGTSVILKTRKGETYISVPHISKDLEKFFAKYPDAVLDGELFNNDMRQKLNDLSSLIRKTKNVTAAELAESEAVVLYYVYDGFDFSSDLNEDASYEDRKAFIDKTLPKLTKYTRLVETEDAFSLKEVDAIFAKHINDGQEGVMVRLKGMTYEVDKRSSSLLKYKPMDDSDAIVRALHEGTGNWAGTAKTATLEWKGITFDATFKGSWEKGAERLKNPKPWIGRKIEFHYFGLTGKGVPNFAQIDPSNCFKYE